MNREEALALLREYTKSENLVKHGLAVEAAMRSYARKFGEDEAKWAIVGLIHDFDYEAFPEQHPGEGARILRERGYPEDVIYAVRAHGDHLGLVRRSPMDKTLFAVDELTGFITAVALVRPSKSLADVDAASVKKKFKDKAFARGVHREDIFKGVEEMGVDLDEHLVFVIDAMRSVALELGLAGGQGER